ncbi:MAG: cbb3-type cytochrome oxidase assembly protein CcoS [Pseudomonadota bacterium]
MNALLFLLPIALILGGLGVAAFFWALKDDQFSDPQGAAERILLDDDQELEGLNTDR